MPEVNISGPSGRIEARYHHERGTNTPIALILHPHPQFGGTMNNIMISPADPIFWLNHGEIDRLWSVWQARPGNAGKNPILSGSDLIMDPWTETATKLRSIAKLKYSYGP